MDSREWLMRARSAVEEVRGAIEQSCQLLDEAERQLDCGEPGTVLMLRAALRLTGQALLELADGRGA